MSPLVEHLPMLIDRAEEICANPRYYHSAMGLLSVAFGGGGELSAGMLLELWRRGEMCITAPCGHRAYIHSLGGSALSGSFSCNVICTHCREAFRKPSTDTWEGGRFHELWRPALEVWEARRARLSVERGERPRFDWGAGVVGKRGPDRVIGKPVKGLPFSQLIDVLLGGPGDVRVQEIDGTPAATFRWSTGELLSPDGRVICRLADDAVQNGAGGTMFTWDGLYLWDGRELPKYEFHSHAQNHRSGVTLGRTATQNVWSLAEEVAEDVSPWDEKPILQILRDGTVFLRGLARWRADTAVPTWALAVLATVVPQRAGSLDAPKIPGK